MISSDDSRDANLQPSAGILKLPPIQPALYYTTASRPTNSSAVARSSGAVERAAVA